jgi:hypothetical protein
MKKGPVPYNITFSMKSRHLFDEKMGAVRSNVQVLATLLKISICANSATAPVVPIHSPQTDNI